MFGLTCMFRRSAKESKGSHILAPSSFPCVMHMGRPSRMLDGSRRAKQSASSKTKTDLTQSECGTSGDSDDTEVEGCVIHDATLVQTLLVQTADEIKCSLQALHGRNAI